MVYKKYVKINGKLHGPYYYESYREGGKVKKRYLGTKPPGSEGLVVLHGNKKILMILVVLGLLLLGAYYVNNLTGKVVLQLESGAFEINDSLVGRALISLDEGDLVGRDLEIVLRLFKEGVVISEVSMSFEEFIDGQVDYVEIVQNSEVCDELVVESIEEVCANGTSEEVVENCVEEEVCEGEFGAHSTCVDEEVCVNETSTETQEVCTDEEACTEEGNETICETITTCVDEEVEVINEVCTMEEVCEESSENCTIEIICVNETIISEVILCENQTVETIEQVNCTTETITSYYYNISGTYSRDLEDLIGYTFEEEGNYVISIEIQGLGLSSEKAFSVSSGEGDLFGTQEFTTQSGAAPGTPTVLLNATTVNNQTTDDLYCWANATDADADDLNYSGYWTKDGVVKVDEVWNASYDGGIGTDTAWEISVDNSGNVYVTGSSRIGGNDDYYTIKYNSSGDEVWNASYDGVGTDVAFGIAVDNSGNVYVTGYSDNGLDDDHYTIKYNSSGDEIWNASYDGGLGDDAATGIAVDNSGNVYVAGKRDTGLYSDYYTIKYNSSGDEIWNASYGGFGWNVVQEIAVDNSGNVYVTGSSAIGGNDDYYTIKYNSSGDEVWNASYNGIANEVDSARGIAVDNSGNVYVTGRSDNGPNMDYYTIKYNSSGDEIWNKSYDGGNGHDEANGIAVDNSGNVYVTGYSDNGPNMDYYTIKYNSSGDEIWNVSYNGIANHDDRAQGIAIDNSGNVYVTGQSYNATGSGNYDYYTIKYNDGFVLNDQTEGVLVNVDSLGSGNTSVGENWSCSVNAYDGTNNSGYVTSGDLEILEAGADNNPIVNLDYPADNSVNDTSQYVNLTFNATVTDDSQLVNCSLWHNATTIWHLNQSEDITGTSNVTDFNLTDLTNVTFIWNIECYDNASQGDWDENRTVILNWTETVAQEPNSTEFNISYGSTNFSDVADLENVTNMTLANQYGKIQFPVDYEINASGEDYDSHIEIGDGFVSVNTSALHSSFNSSANVTIIDVSCPATVYYGGGVYSSASGVLDEENICNADSDPNCTNIVCDVNNLTFTVSHFTGFASGGTANLTIWDETDSGMPYAGETRYSDEQVKFFANYTNSTGAIEGASCSINFSDSSGDMVWNSSGFYDYNRSFSSAGTYDWNVTCNKSGYDNLTANDSVLIISNIAPNMTQVLLNSSFGTNYSSENLTCWANATDADADDLNYSGYWMKNGIMQVLEVWSSSYDGGAGTDEANGIAVDNSGNVYVTGYFYNGANNDYYTIKYNSTGDEVWNVSYNSSGIDEANGIAVDNSGNVYVTGTSNSDYYTIKYNSSGDEVWNASYNGAANEDDVAQGIAVDISGNVYVTGASDYNYPESNYHTIKYNSTGGEIWNASYDGGYDLDVARGIAVDNSGNVYVTGQSSTTGPDWYTIKYNSTGGEIWNASYIGYGGTGTDVAYGIAVDNSGNVYVAGHAIFVEGTHLSYYLIKYNSTGGEIWNANYTKWGSNDHAYGIALDNLGNVYVTGDSGGVSTYDYYTIKYNSSGDEIWNKSYDSGDEDEAYGIAVDNSGNVYVTGREGVVTSYDWHTIKYNDGFVLNDQTEGILVNVGTLGSGNTSVGENWSCSVNAYDGIDNSGYVASGDLEILAVDNPPNITQVLLNSSSGNNYTADDLYCWANATDANGDDLNYSGYWMKNGVQNISFVLNDQTEGVLVNVATLGSGNTSVGENWSCSVNAYDGTDNSGYNISNNLTVESLPASCDSMIYGCGYVLSSAGTRYCLAQNVSTTGNCLRISSSNIVLNCLDYNITGDGDTGEYGVFVDNAFNATIKNCGIRTFYYGIMANNSDSIRVEDNNIVPFLAAPDVVRYGINHSGSDNGVFVNNNILVTEGDKANAIYIEYGNNNTIKNNTLGNYLNSKNHGVYLYHSDNNTVVNNSISDFFIGILDDYADSIRVENNTLLHNDRGIQLGGAGDPGGPSDNAQIINNLIDGESSGTLFAGITLLKGGDNTLIRGNTITGYDASSTDNGIYIYDSSNLATNISIRYNNINNNGFGINMFLMRYGEVVHNTVNNNDAVGIILSYGSASNNLVANNTIQGNREGIWMNGAVLNDIENNTITNNWYGVKYIGGSNKNDFTGNMIDSNTYYGIYPDTAGTWSRENFVNNSISNNGWSGIYINKNTYSLNFENNTINGNGFSGSDNYKRSGISTFYNYHIQNISFIGNDIKNNNYAGLYLWGHSSIELTNFTLSGNNITNSSYGLILNKHINDTIEGNYIQNNSYGINLISSSGNLIYDNYFDNTNNVDDDGTNYWNTTLNCSSGISNVINRSCFGGNYWADYSGRDTSGDWIGDTNLPYKGTASITIGGDYLPLVHNSPPRHEIPILNSTDGTDYTTQNLTVYNQSTIDSDNDSVKNIIDWKKDGSSIAVLNMLFAGESNATFTKDYSSYGNNGTVIGATWNSTGGYDGFGAYEFDGNSTYISISNESGIGNPGSEVTVSAWVYANTLGGVTDKRIVSCTEGNGYSMGIVGGDWFRFRISVGGSYHYAITPIVNTGIWYHVVGVYNNSLVKIYLNGTEYIGHNISGDINASNQPLCIGGESNGGTCDSAFWNGTIDDLVIYNYSLSAEQISTLYNNRTDLIVSQETSVGDVWQACVTPNDKIDDGFENCSNSLIVLEVPSGDGDGGGGDGGEEPSPDCTDDDYGDCSWTECVGGGIEGTQENVCLKIGDCTGAPTRVLDIRSCVLPCDEDWDCDWVPAVCGEGDTEQVFVCVDLNECTTEDDKPGEDGDTKECYEDCIPNPDPDCGEWSECQFESGDSGEILAGEIVYEGTKIRYCDDGCGEYTESKTCERRESLDLEVSEDITGRTVLRAINEDGVPVMQIDLLAFIDEGKLDLTFTQGKEKYLPSCYNGILDGDETDVDCGGSCKICGIRERSKFMLWPWWVAVGLAGLLMLLLGTLARDTWIIAKIRRLLLDGKGLLGDVDVSDAMGDYEEVRPLYSKVGPHKVRGDIIKYRGKTRKLVELINSIRRK